MKYRIVPMKKILKITINCLFITLFLVVFSGCGISTGSNVKKSDTGLCHEKGTNYYKNTKKFTSYSSIDDCLNSGGRLPKK